MSKKSSSNVTIKVVLFLMATLYNLKPSLKKYLKSTEGWINFSVGIRTESGSIEQAIIFNNGKVRLSGKIPTDVSVSMAFVDDNAAKDMLSATPNEAMNMLLRNRMRMDGNLGYIQLFLFLVSQLTGKKNYKAQEKEKALDKEMKTKGYTCPDPEMRNELSRRRKARLKGIRVDAGVKYLEDPYLSQYDLDDFPRLKEFVDIHFTTKPALCHERPKLLTDWHAENGFEVDKKGRPWVPELRQAYAYKYLMENRKPLIRKNDLIAGTTTTKDIGVVIYPDGAGNTIWGELLTVPNRVLQPYDVSPETVDILHHYVFPYWIKRNFREWVRHKYQNPLCQQLDDRFAVYFLWKTVAISHTIPDFPKILRLGTKGIAREIKDEMKRDAKADGQKKDTLKAMLICMEGLSSYARNLSRQAALEASKEKNARRKAELEKLSQICARVPENPAETLDEAMNAVWICWVGLHMENTNAGLSLGRLDQWLQPYFEADIKRLQAPQEREEYIKHAIDLIGCFYMRCTDHLPLVPDIGNFLFGGSSSDQAITLGGVTPQGEDAVSDMTYIFLKVTELLNIRDPNVNARYNPQKNSDTYLKRLCEVNFITAATPSMHNDVVVMESLKEFNYPVEDLRDWAATGCVEPTLCGKHMGHTNCMMMNMVAALEMALNNGKHPLMNWEVGPKTGDIHNGGFKTFDDFYNAFTAQFKFLIDKSVEYNNILGKAHQYLRPTPLLSSLIDGCIRNGRDLTRAGAKHNSSGNACIGLADVTDSLMAIKKLVYDEKKVTFKELKEAIDNNFADNAALYAIATRKVPFFGSGSEEAVAMADRVTQFAHDCYANHTNYRGGKYTAGFWSMSNHVAFGTLAGALPSGRLAYKPFTPGLTPEPNASKNLLDNIRDVAKLNPHHMNNNIAFNVKVVPSAKDTHQQVVDHMYAYAKTYFDLGGMQMQMNVVTSAMLRDAMAHPEDYRNLLVRISGYNAYFVTLNRDLQLELIERAEYGI
ncbi:MAG: formate acetyltransferase [Chloroflexi bacterium]|nr:formate acetyltransferase [Chloroflexota bacterium]